MVIIKSSPTHPSAKLDGVTVYVKVADELVILVNVPEMLDSLAPDWPPVIAPDGLLTGLLQE